MRLKHIIILQNKVRCSGQQRSTAVNSSDLSGWPSIEPAGAGASWLRPLQSLAVPAVGIAGAMVACRCLLLVRLLLEKSDII